MRSMLKSSMPAARRFSTSARTTAAECLRPVRRSASLALNELFSAGSGAWAFLPVLRLPIFDAGRYRAELDVAKVREHIAVADYERTIQRAFRDVADALVARPYGWVVVAEMYNTADAQAARRNSIRTFVRWSRAPARWACG